MHRRGLLAAIAASSSVAVAGCAGAGGENGNYEFDAEPATVPSPAASEAGYDGEEPESFTVEQEFDVAGVNAQLSATTWITRYENADNGSALSVASTPDASVGGQSVNPLVRADDAELIRRLLEQVDQRGIGGNDTEIETSDIEERGSETRTVLDKEVEIAIFETTVNAEVNAGNGQSGEVEDVPVYLYVGTVQHDEDVIALIGVHPAAVDASDSLLSLMGQVEH
ncbi:hypothetical protein DJ71_18665 [Halorubrum sp. E3]|uniref:Prokaryotic membrane lipoprotein lipid attachment site profile n=1 Tax=Halorubrum persicum TaxID=1383844 RepID=A0A2G1WJY6_9EURY|nr:DUF6517 family protein [Halorubrum persicum]OYR75882.1 hypothetical protein DJ71_18665 [Halorubrum sp. E3]PHQ39331.1 hypothetical protein DJ69_07480 [Halorubrum persicum]